MTVENTKPVSGAKPRARSNGRAFISFAEDPLWYKDAVIYQLHVKSFFDANNDGIGDFPGLIAKLDYIKALGVNTIWLLPFYPSPRRDDGYDIAEYKDVHSDYGTMADVKRFIAEAHKCGLRVISELVINHTSDQHPWFQRARHAKPGSAARDFYVWSDDNQRYDGTRIIFLDTEKSNWTWDPVANAFFWHRFYSHQPDLNFDNPNVLKAVLGIMSFWLDIGIDGMRLDAVPYLIEREGTSNENLPETHAILKKIRAHLDEHFPDRMLLAEANMWPEDVQQYFGDDDECQMAFHFPLMPRMYMALAQDDRFPITDILRQTPDIPADCQWAIFLRNHDELTLEMVTDHERDYLWNFYAADRRARINLGIRRRLAPLLEGDRRRIELLNSLLLSMPGTPVIYYGDEIGMGDNIHLGDRDGVRTPMQWAPDRNGGFSRADPASLVLPPIMDPLYGYEAVNVEAQSRNPYSLLNWMRRLLEVRSQHHAFGRGTLKLIYPNNRKILAYLREVDAGEKGIETILCVANVSRASQAVEIDLSAFAGRVPVEMLGGTAFPPIGQLTYQLTLPPFGFYWFVLAAETSLPSWHTPRVEQLPEYATLVLRHGVQDLLQGAARATLERETLPQYLPKRRWYAAKQRQLEAAQIALATLLPPAAAAEPPQLLAEVVVITTDGGSERYLIPLGFISENDASVGLPQQLALARVRRERSVGMLTDAFTLDAFVFRMLDLIREQATIVSADGEIRCTSTASMHALTLPPQPDIRRISTEQSNSSVVIGDTIVLKVIRRLTPGLNPEVEMGRYLTERGYANSPALLGDVTRYAADGTPHTMMVAQRFVHNQGDAWNWTQNTLARAVLQADVLEPDAAGAAAMETIDPMLELTQFAGTLGRRLGELHSVLAQPSDDPAFAPEQVDRDGAAHWAIGVRRQLDAAFGNLQAKSDWDVELAQLASSLLARREQLYTALARLAVAGTSALRIRIHGDFHLGQTLVAPGDVYLVDFEGEPARTPEQRREKSSPWRDVAGLLRSFDYAAAFAGSAGPGDLGETAQAAKKQILERYLPASRDAFLQAYRAAAPEAAAVGGAAMLDLFTLEKAAYEICYEAANRPAWLTVPLRGLAAVADNLLQSDEGVSTDG